MNTFSTQSNMVRQKIQAEVMYKLSNQISLYHPREDNSGNYYVSSHAGEILKFTDTISPSVFMTIGGQPNCVAFDNTDTIYYADLAHSTVFLKSLGTTNRDKNSVIDNDEEKIVCKDYNGNPLKGPTSIVYNKDEETLLITDGGSFGTSSLNRTIGSLFIYDVQSNVSRPLLFNCLAYPADLCLDSVRNTVYLCETFTNRIIRIVQRDGIYNCSIFYQFVGRVGPTAITLDDTIGNIYVARYEFQNEENDIDGIISVLNKEGVLLGEIVIPKLPEITGLLIPSKSKDQIIITEKNANCIYKIKLSNFMNEVDKFEENNKLII